MEVSGIHILDSQDGFAFLIPLTEVLLAKIWLEIQYFAVVEYNKVHILKNCTWVQIEWPVLDLIFLIYGTF